MIIAEIGSVHDGSFGNAKKLIELASHCGADCVKFQTHIAEAETLEEAPAPSYFKGEPRYQYFKRTSFSHEQWDELKIECIQRNIKFVSSPFSIEAVDLLESLDIPFYKIPSGEVTNIPLLEAVAKTNKKILISSGMSSWNELDNAIATIRKYHNDIVVMQCTSEYPCEYDRVGLNILAEMKKRYNIPVGLSDHTLTNYASFAAITLGAEVVEKHLTFSRKMYGSDAKHSLEPNEFIDLVNGIEAIKIMLSTKCDKNEITCKLENMKQIFEKSIVASVDIKKGTTINYDMMSFKKPGSGMSPSDYPDLIGKVIKKDLKRNEQFNINLF